MKLIENIPKCFRETQTEQTASRQAAVETRDQCLTSLQLEIDRHILTENNIDAGGIGRKWIEQIERLKAHQRPQRIADHVAIIFGREVARQQIGGQVLQRTTAIEACVRLPQGRLAQISGPDL